MNKEEIEQFKQTIEETILPHVLNISNEKVAELVYMIQNQNPDLPEGFGSMLLEQLLVMKGGADTSIASTSNTSSISQTDTSDPHDLTKLF